MTINQYIVTVLICFAIKSCGVDASKRTLYALCHPTHIEVTVVLDDTAFYGLVQTRPNRNTCAVWGSGEKQIKLFIPLTDPDMTGCGVVKTNDFYTAVVDVRRNQALELLDDSSFLVQCSADQVGTPNAMIPSQVLSLTILSEEQKVFEAHVSDKYIIEVDVPDVFTYHVSSCAAFTGDDTIHFIPIIDAFGCPIDASTITPFLPVPQSNKLRSEIVMFRFNESHQFYVQCNVVQCEGLCTQAICTPRTNVNLLSLHKVIRQNEMEALVSSRVMVMDKWQTAKIVRTKTCDIPNNPSLIKLIVTVAVLILLNIVSGYTAWRNRPLAFRCDETDETDSTPLKLPTYKMLPFSLALPPLTMTENNKDNLISTLSTRTGRSSSKKERTMERTDNSLDDNDLQHVHDDLDGDLHNIPTYVDMSITTAMTERSVIPTLNQSESHPTMIVRRHDEFTMRRQLQFVAEGQSPRKTPGGGILVIRDQHEARMADSTLGRKRPTVRIMPEFINDDGSVS